MWTQVLLLLKVNWDKEKLEVCIAFYSFGAGKGETEYTDVKLTLGWIHVASGNSLVAVAGAGKAWAVSAQPRLVPLLLTAMSIRD